jgi:hypothetical protein
MPATAVIPAKACPARISKYADHDIMRVTDGDADTISCHAEPAIRVPGFVRDKSRAITHRGDE